MASVERRPGGKWRARWREAPGAPQRARHFDTKREAERFLVKVQHDLLAGSYVDPSAGRVLFGAYAAAWAERQPHRASTAQSVEVILRRHVLPTFEHRPLASIRPSDVQAWVARLSLDEVDDAGRVVRRGLAPSTMEVVYGKVAAIFRSAVEDRVIASSPCGRSIRLPRPEGGEVVPMSPGEVRAMVDAVSDRYRALVILLAGSGLRPSEALGLTVDRVDWLRRTVRVDRQLVTLSGSAPTLGPPKTPSSVRTVPVPDDVVLALSVHRERFELGPWGLLFTDGKGDPIRRNALGHLWRRAASRVGVVDRSPHDLRHYCASVLIDRGASVKAVQRHLGHASAKTTLDTYAHLWPDAEDVTRAALASGLVEVLHPTEDRPAMRRAAED